MSTKIIECHDCANESKIKDNHDEIDVNDLKYCPYCGSDNIDASNNAK